MKTHKTRVSNSPGKLRLLETCQHEFREKLNIRHACYIIIAELSYETQYKTWLRPPLRINAQGTQGVLLVFALMVPTLSGGRRTFLVVPSFFWYISTEEV